jgi:hypothetical protein
MITKGMCLLAHTKTLQDVFGDVLWDVTEVGLPFKKKGPDGKFVEGVDGVKLVMACGTGPSARRGYTVVDSEENIEAKIAQGIVQNVTAEVRATLEEAYSKKESKAL